MGKIFLDLDGPVLDNRQKYFNIYCDLLKDKVGELLDNESYWALKRNKTPERKILEGILSGPEIERYESERLKRIEVIDYLKQDKLQPLIVDTIRQWKQHHNIYLVTIRKNRKTLLQQLEFFGLSDLFEQVFSEDNNVGDWTVKARLLKNEITDPRDCVIIGDTEADVEAGKNLGIRTIGVACGIRSHEFLRALQPDFIYDFSKDVRIDLLLKR